jgi:hypothetical protein
MYAVDCKPHKCGTKDTCEDDGDDEAGARHNTEQLKSGTMKWVEGVK